MRVTVVLRMVLESYNDVLSDAKITFKIDEINLIGKQFNTVRTALGCENVELE